MKLKRLQVNNFLGIGKIDIDLDGRGLVMVEGVNEDSPTASSNGAGKSTIFEAIYWALYGKTKRGLTGDDVVNETAGKNCWVNLEFHIGERSYMVMRGRKETSLKLLQASEVSGEIPRDLTRATIKDTQEFLESIIRMSDSTFSKVACFGQGDIKAFASMSDAELKQVFEQALGITYFTEYLTRAKSHKTGLEAESVAIEMELSKMEMERKFLEEKIELLERSRKELQEKQKSELERMHNELTRLHEEERTIRSVKYLSLEEVEVAIASCNEAEAQRKRLLEMRSELTTRYNEENAKYLAEKTRAEVELEGIRKGISAIERAKAKVGTDCQECGKSYIDADIEGFKTTQATELEKANARLRERKGLMRASEEELEKLRELDARLSTKIEKFSEAHSELKALEV